MERPNPHFDRAVAIMAESRSRISSAALFENVRMRIEPALAPFSSRYSTRCVNVRVLPVPGPASTISGPPFQAAAAF